MSASHNSWLPWIEKQTVHKNYPFCLALLLGCYVVFLAFPGFAAYEMREEGAQESWDVAMLKSRDLTNSLTDYDPNTWLAKKVFRLTVPFAIKIFHLNRTGVIIIQYALGFLFIYFAYLLINRITRDAVSSTFFAAGLSVLYCGRACFTDLRFEWFDGWAYFFLLMTLFDERFVAVFLFATLAAWTDERAFVALPLTILFHQVSSNVPTRFEWKGLSALRPSGAAVIVAMLGYVVVRLILTFHYGMHTPTSSVGLSILTENIVKYRISLGAFTFFEGFWLLVPIAYYLALGRKHYLFIVLIFLQMAVSSILAFSVFDITRSGSYLFPLIFVLVVYISHFTQLRELRYIVLISMFFSFIFPPLNYITAFGIDDNIGRPIILYVFPLVSRLIHG
jgi:hypothetical protein